MRLALLPVLLLAAAPAEAEVELSFYGGWSGAPDGGVTLSDEDVEAEGQRAMGYGARAVWWSESDFGVALDYSRLGGEAEGVGVTVGDLETLTVGGMYRWEDAIGGVTPYVGAGLGLAMGEAEVVGAGSADLSGTAASFVAGASVPITESLSVFGEFEGTYSDLEGELEDGRSVESDGLSNSINLGVSFSF